MMRRRLTGLRPLQRRALRIARRIEHLSAKVAGAHGVARDPGLVSVRRARPTERPPGTDWLARVPGPAPEAAPALPPVVDVDDGFRIEAPATVAPREAAPSAPPSPEPRPEPEPAATQTPGGTRLLRRADPDPPPPDLPDDMRFLWDVWQREKPGGRGVLERGRGARILEGEAPRDEGPAADSAGLARVVAEPPSHSEVVVDQSEPSGLATEPPAFASEPPSFTSEPPPSRRRLARQPTDRRRPRPEPQDRQPSAEPPRPSPAPTPVEPMRVSRKPSNVTDDARPAPPTSAPEPPPAAFEPTPVTAAPSPTQADPPEIVRPSPHVATPEPRPEVRLARSSEPTGTAIRRPPPSAPPRRGPGASRAVQVQRQTPRPAATLARSPAPAPAPAVEAPTSNAPAPAVPDLTPVAAPAAPGPLRRALSRVRRDRAAEAATNPVPAPAPTPPAATDSAQPTTSAQPPAPAPQQAQPRPQPQPPSRPEPQLHAAAPTRPLARQTVRPAPRPPVRRLNRDEHPPRSIHRAAAPSHPVPPPAPPAPSFVEPPPLSPAPAPSSNAPAPPPAAQRSTLARQPTHGGASWALEASGGMSLRAGPAPRGIGTAGGQCARHRAQRLGLLRRDLPRASAPPAGGAGTAWTGRR